MKNRVFKLLFLVLLFICAFMTLSACNKTKTTTLNYTLIDEGSAYKVSGTYAKCPKSVVIPSTHKGKPVTSIGNYAFDDCSELTSITIPNSVTSIGEWAFAFCSGLTSIAIPNSVTSIGDFAFSGCSGLTSITIPNSVTSIGEMAFSYCSGLTGITIPDSVAWVGRLAFSNTPWYDDQPYGVVYAGKVLYEYKGTMPSNTAILVKEGTKGIGDSAFQYCRGLTSITIPDSVTNIGDYAFEYCSELMSITIPNSVKSIGGWAFQYCSGLTSITIPDSVTSIEDGAFEYCRGLTRIDFGGTEAQWNAISKGGGWKYDTGDFTVECSDGTLTKAEA